MAIASSGIAATLLPGGRTAHSALKLPLNLHSTETPTCNISKSSGMDKVLQQCKLIIWDEKSLEALDQCLKDLRGKSKPFGSTLILLVGDFRQTLPIIPRSTLADEMNACLKNSNLWAHVKTLNLTTNMRVRLQNDDSGQTFSDQLLVIGNGKLPVDSISGRIQLPADIFNLVTSKNELIEKVVPNILNNYKNNKWLSERAILAPKNIDAHEINNIVLTKIRDQAVL